MNRNVYYNIKDETGYQKHITTKMILCILFVAFCTLLIAKDTEQNKKIELGIVDFLYVTDAGYDPQYSFEKNIEKHILIPTLNRDISNLPNIVTLQALRGNLEFLASEESIRYRSRSPYDSYDLIMWGLVVPWKWPNDYDLYLLMFTNSSKDVYTSLNFSLKIRNKRIAAWNGESCSLPEEAMAIIPEIMCSKIKLLRNSTDQAGTNSRINKKMQERIRAKGFRYPDGAFHPLFQWYPNKKYSYSNVGSIELELNQYRYVILQLSEEEYNELERLVILNKPLSWPLEQGSLVLPEISFSNNNSTEYIPSEQLGNDYSQTSQDEFMVGILPFENNSDQRGYDWIGFGLEYLLSNKLATISGVRILERDVFERAVQNSVTTVSDTHKVKIHNDVKTLGFNLGISGNYVSDKKDVAINLNFINTIDGDTISSRQYSHGYYDLFSISDDIARDFIELTAISLTNTEKRMIGHRLTSSVSAFQNFCMGYIENEKPGRDLDVIIQYFQTAVKNDPQFWEAHYNLGIAFYNNRDNKNALKQFNDLINLLPNFEKPYVGRGLTYLRLKEYDLAEQDLLSAMRLDPNDYKSYYYLGKLYIARKQYNVAKNYLRKAAELNPGNGNIYYELGNIFYAQHQFKSALPYYKKAMLYDPDNLPGHQKLGECYYHAHSFNSASEEFAMILQVQPGDPEANFMSGITGYKQAVLDDFIIAFLEMMDLRISTKQKQKYKSNGLEAKRRKIYRQMINKFKKAYLNRTNFYEATFNIALTYQEMGEIDSAIIYYEKTVGIIPNSVKANLMLGKLYEAEDDQDRALEYYKSVVRIEPSYFISYPDLGEEYDHINIIELVGRELEDELRADPHDVKANLSLARIYYTQGYYGKAANLYRRVLSIYPGNKNAKKMLAQLGNL